VLFRRVLLQLPAYTLELLEKALQADATREDGDLLRRFEQMIDEGALTGKDPRRQPVL
jgi:hypothetical protein